MKPTETNAKFPSHVPEELVYSFNNFEPIMFQDPYSRIREVAREAPKIFYSLGYPPLFEPGWMLTRHEDIRDVAQNTEVFTSKKNFNMPKPAIEGDNEWDLIPLELDPPHHDMPRGMLMPILSPKAVAAMEDDIRELVISLIGEMKEGGNTADFVEAFAVPLPSIMFCKLSGLPEERSHELVEWNNQIIHAKSLEECQQGGELIRDLLDKLVDDLKANPNGTIISKVVNEAEIDGRSMNKKEIISFCFMLFLGGLDTVTNALGNVFAYLVSHLDQRDQLVKDPTLIPAAVEELLRTQSVIYVNRRALVDTEIDGVFVKAGDIVTLLLPAANYNQEVFEDAESVDFTRDMTPHFTFGVGPHRCIGSHLARKEITVAVEELLKALPEIRLREGESLKADCAGTYGYCYVPVEW